MPDRAEAEDIELSVVVPMWNEEENVRPLVGRVEEALRGGRSWELLLVDDGSTDGTRRLAREAADDDPRVRAVCLARNYGQSTAMQAGFDRSRGRIVVTMDGDLQNDPADIPRLVEKLEEGYDLVAGYRVDREDDFLTRKVPSWAANRLLAWITGVPIRDNGCSLKAYTRELLDRVRLYSEMHRFIPALAAGTARARIAQVGVRHHPRRRGQSKYGLSRVFSVLADLLTVKMIRSFRNRPLTAFAYGATLPAVGAALAGAAGLAANLLQLGPGADSVVLTGVSLILAALAVFLVLLGLVAEVVVRTAHDGKTVPAPLAREMER